MDSSLYSQSKALYHHDRLNALKCGIQPKPVHVQLILSDLCNQDCNFCAYRMSSGLSTELFATEKTHNPNRQIDFLKAHEILADCAQMGVKAIQFTGGGEPTVHKDHLALFDIAQELGMETALVTNGTKLKNHNAIKNMTWIRVSVDAGTEHTYYQTRRSAAWKTVWKNLKELRFDGTLGIGFVVTPLNYEEISMCAHLAREVGADNLRVGAVFSSEGLKYYDGKIEHIIEAIERAKTLETDDFKIIDLFGRRINDLEARPEDPFCAYQYFTTYIGADLNVYRCCNTAYTTKGLLGNLEDMRFSELMPELAPFDARNCRFCQFKGQNEAINAALIRPSHENFV